MARLLVQTVGYGLVKNSKVIWDLDRVVRLLFLKAVVITVKVTFR